MSTQNEDQPADNQAKEESLGAFVISKALFELFETALPNMSKTQLKLMTRANGFAQMQTENMAEIVDALALLIANDDKDDKDEWDFKRCCPKLLWQLSYQFDLIAGLMELGSSAEFKLNNPEA
jgi:hypothetical protein